MAYENILFEVKDEIATLTFNRPKVLNALTFQTLKEVGEAISTIETEENVRALILTGAGDRAFPLGQEGREVCPPPGNSGLADGGIPQPAVCRHHPGKHTALQSGGVVHRGIHQRIRLSEILLPP